MMAIEKMHRIKIKNIMTLTEYQKIKNELTVKVKVTLFKISRKLKQRKDYHLTYRWIL